MNAYSQVEILVEELSMKLLLEGLLPQLLPEKFQLNTNVFIRAFEGKQHLKKQLPMRIRAFQNFGIPVRVIVIQDQDSNDCVRLKESLAQIIQNNGSLPYLIRIACRELEAFYFGELHKLELVYPRFNASKYSQRAKFRSPDQIESPSGELSKMISEFQKVKTARALGSLLSPSENASPSFLQLCNGIRKFLT